MDEKTNGNNGGVPNGEKPAFATRRSVLVAAFVVVFFIFGLFSTLNTFIHPDIYEFSEDEQEGYADMSGFLSAQDSVSGRSGQPDTLSVITLDD